MLVHVLLTMHVSVEVYIGSSPLLLTYVLSHGGSTGPCLCTIDVCKYKPAALGGLWHKRSGQQSSPS